MRVGIVGSGPDPDLENLGACQTIVFANGAVSYAPRSRGSRRIWMLSTSLLLGRSVDNLQRKKRESIVGVAVDMVVVTSVLPPAAIAGLLAQYSVSYRELMVLKPRDRAKMTKRIGGRGLAVKSLMQTGYVPGLSRYVAKRLSPLKSFGLAVVPAQDRDLPHQLRPSTGVFSIVWSLWKRPSREHFVTGISVDTAEYQVNDLRIMAGSRGHMPTDLFVLQRIARGPYRVFTSSQSLAALTGLQCCSR